MTRRLAWLLLLLPALALADEVYLKGAGKLSGKVVEERDGTVMVDVGDGVVGVPASRIDRIVKGPSPLDEYQTRAKALQPNDTRSWRNLGHWAEQQGLFRQSKEAYQHVLQTAPDDLEARAALGYVQHGGKWVTEEESYAARGFVQYNGAWMSPEQAQAEQAAEAADEQRRNAAQAETDAAVAQMKQEIKERDAAQQARDDEERRRRDWNTWGSWGSWGYGMTYSPTGMVLNP